MIANRLLDRVKDQNHHHSQSNANRGVNTSDLNGLFARSSAPISERNAH